MATVAGFRRFRRVVSHFVVAVILLAPLMFAVPSVALAKIHVTGVSATPTYVSRHVSPKRLKIRYTIDKPGYVTISVTSSSGLTKRLLTSTRRTAGSKTVYWNLKTKTGAWAKSRKYTVNIAVKDGSGHKATPYPARVSARLDNIDPSCSVTGVSPSSITPSSGESSTITYSMSDNLDWAKLQVTLEIVNASGTVVRSIVQTGVAQGSGKKIVWDGTTNGGGLAASGPYSARVRVKDLAGNTKVSATGAGTAVSVNAWSRERPLDLTPYSSAMVRSDTRGRFTHVVWNDGSTTGDRIRYRRVDELGNTVVAPVLVATATYEPSSLGRGLPDVSADASGGAYVVWRGTGRSTSYKGIWLARLDPQGRVAWKKMIFSEWNSYNLLDPRVSASASGLVHVVCWKDGSPNAVYYSVFRADGNDYIGWTPLATGTLGGQRKLPNIEVDDSERVHVLWYDAIDHPGTSYVGYRELYYTRLVFDDGYVTDPGAGGTISRKRLTSTTKGYSPEVWDAPEMAVDSVGALHVAWPDKVTATSSNGVRYLKLASDGSVAVASKVAFDGSTTAVGQRYGRNQAIVALPGGSARIVCSARTGTSGPYRLWQIDVSPTGVIDKPFTITNSGGRTDSEAEDMFASLGIDSDGIAHLVYLADNGLPVQGTSYQRVVHRDLSLNTVANDTSRADLEIDAAHVVHSSAPSPPRQNTPVSVVAEIRNAGWAPILGGTATLSFEGVPTSTVAIPPLGVEATAAVTLPWTVPSDATRTPAALMVGVAPLGDTTQTASTNDTAAVPLVFSVPPTETALIVEVFDETYDPYRNGNHQVPTATVTLSGTIEGGGAYLSTGTVYADRTEFMHVPLGSYTVSISKPGYVVSAPTTRAVTIARDPGDAYKLNVTPGNLIGMWVNRWGGISGTVHESLGTTPVVGATVTLLETGETTTSVAGGAYRFTKLCEGPYTIRAKKVGYERRTQAVVVSATSTTTADVPLVATADGYLVGAVVDEGGQPIVNDPAAIADDPTVKIKRTGFSDRTITATDGVIDVKLLNGSYTLDVSAPGYKTTTGVPVSIVAGEERDGTTELVLDVSALTHKQSPERWVAPWTLKANWFGDQPPGSMIPSYSIISWHGLFRFRFNEDHQRVGTADYIRYVKPWFEGQAWEWTYFFGVDPPVAPKVFRYEQDLLGVYDDRFQPPMLIEGSRWNRSGVRVDGIDIVDERDGTVVSQIRSQWNSCDEPDGHLYGYVTGAAEGDQSFPAYTHTVPLANQVVRLWLTVGRMDEDGHFVASRFGDIGRFNQGQLMQATGYNKLRLSWRPADDELWVEPALVDYPSIP